MAVYWRSDRTKRFHELWALGLHDQAIADAMGMALISVTRRRNKLGWACNPTPGALTEITARAENEAPWEPPPGMTKRRCLTCWYWFSAVDLTTMTCPDCRANPKRRAEP